MQSPAGARTSALSVPVPQPKSTNALSSTSSAPASRCACSVVLCAQLFSRLFSNPRFRDCVRRDGLDAREQFPKPPQCLRARAPREPRAIALATALARKPPVRTSRRQAAASRPPAAPLIIQWRWLVWPSAPRVYLRGYVRSPRARIRLLECSELSLPERLSAPSRWFSFRAFSSLSLGLAYLTP
jgi:hypothetical protein